MRLAFPSLILFTYVSSSLIGFVPCRPFIKAIVGGILALISMKYIIYDKILGSFIAPEIPRWLMLLMEAMYASMVILFFLLIVKDLAAILLLISRALGTSWRLPFSSAARSAALSLLALGLGIFGTWQAVKVPAIRTVEIPVHGLPDSLNGFSVVQLTDIHIGTILKKEWLQHVVERANSTSPDIVAITGDMIDGYPEELESEVSPLANLQSRYGVFGVTGNHEYYFHAEKWVQLFEQLGIRMLNNAHQVIKTDENAEIVIAGIPDPTERYTGGSGPDLRRAMEGAPDTVRILMAHRPSIPAGEPEVDIQLSGHTHGGMIFFLKPLLARFNGGVVSGRYDSDGTTLYVSPGTGVWAGFSCRLGVPSEITRIVLRPVQS